MAINHPYQGHYMEGAFVGFVMFAQANLMDQFERENPPLSVGRTPMERMVDQATGHDQAEAQRFVDWCVTQFGTPEQIGA